MTPGQGEAAAEYLAIAREALEDADDDMAEGRVRSALDRLYYCSLMAAKAALKTRGKDSRTHTGIQALVREVFVEPGVMAAEHGDLLPKALELRMKADYDPMAALTLGQAEELRPRVVAFLQACERIVEDALARGPDLEDPPPDL